LELGRLVAWQPLERRYLITQTSEMLRALQSTTCSRTSLEPLSRSVRGVMFWLESEARVATAPIGMMKKRKEGFSMFVFLFGVGVALMVNRIGREFFRVMSSIVSIVFVVDFLGLGR
jgi:hypothetical protein